MNPNSANSHNTRLQAGVEAAEVTPAPFEPAKLPLLVRIAMRIPRGMALGFVFIVLLSAGYFFGLRRVLTRDGATGHGASYQREPVSPGGLQDRSPTPVGKVPAASGRENPGPIANVQEKPPVPRPIVPLPQREHRTVAQSSSSSSGPPEKIAAIPGSSPVSPANPSLPVNVTASSDWARSGSRPEASKPSGDTAASAAAPVTDTDILSFLDRLRMADKAKDLDSVLTYYSDRVDFYEKGTLDHISIRSIMEGYYKKFPTGKYERITEPLISPDGPNRWTVVYQIGFQTESTEKRITGKVELHLVVARQEGAFKITSEKSRRLEQETEALAGAKKGKTPVMDAAEARRFAAAAVEAEQSHDLDRILNYYSAGTVNYFDKPRATRAVIRQDKAEYFQKWTATTNEILHPPTVSVAGDGRWRLQFPALIQGRSDSGETMARHVDQILIVSWENGAWRIVDQKGPVTKKLR
jgi:ketosteroid isomerase-like protein